MTLSPPPGPMTPTPAPDPVSPVAAMVERDGGEPGVVERAGEAVVAAGVLRRAVRDEHDAAGRVDRPPAGEHVDTMGVDERPLLHRGPRSPHRVRRCRRERKSTRIPFDDFTENGPWGPRGAARRTGAVRRDHRARADGGRNRPAPDAGVGASAAQRHRPLADRDDAVRRPARDGHGRNVPRARRAPDHGAGRTRGLAGALLRPRRRRRDRRRRTTTRTGTLIVVDARTGAVEFAPGEPVTMRFDGLPAGEKRVEVWLPQGAAVRLIELRADGSVGPPAPTASPEVGALRQLDLALRRSDPADRGLAGRGRAPRRRRPPELRVRRPVPARPVRGPDDRAAARRPDQREARDQRRERRHHARARRSSPPSTACSTRSATGTPTSRSCSITPIICPVAEDHPGPTLLRRRPVHRRRAPARSSARVR